MLVLTRPDVIGAIHREYLAAGADIIETNTFSSTAIAQADYGLEHAGLRAERRRRPARPQAAATSGPPGPPTSPRFVAGAMGPTNRTLSISPGRQRCRVSRHDVRQCRAAYEEQVRGLIDGGADMLLLETIFDTLNAKAAIVAIENVFEERGIRLPLMISVTITDRSGRTLSGQMLDAFYTSIRHARPFCVGINCALGARDMRPYLAELARIAECYVSCYPNAGLPNAFGDYDEQPAETERSCSRSSHQRLRQHRRRLLRHDAGPHRGDRRGGGRGGAAAAAAAAILRDPDRTCIPDPDDDAPAPVMKRRAPRAERRERGRAPTSTPVLRPRDADHPPRQQLPDDRRADQRHRLGAVRAPDQERRTTPRRRRSPREQVRGGANIIDVNMDEGMLDSEQAMTTFLNYIATEPEIARRAGHDRQLEVVGDRSRASSACRARRSSTRSA